MKTESNIRPASQFEIEALPPIEEVLHRLYMTISGTFTRRLQEKTGATGYFT